jgi:hypothetical protein
MALPWFVWVILVTPLVALFAEPAVEKRLRKRPKATVAWGYFFRISWGVTAWFWLTVFAGMVLQKFFPEQSVYMFSGSDITLWPSVILAMAIGWLVIGPENNIEAKAGRYSSFERRSSALLSLTLKIGKWLGLIALGLLGLLLFFWVADGLKDAIESMSTSEAVFAGAVIIALATYYGLRARR